MVSQRFAISERGLQLIFRVFAWVFDIPVSLRLHVLMALWKFRHFRLKIPQNSDIKFIPIFDLTHLIGPGHYFLWHSFKSRFMLPSFYWGHFESFFLESTNNFSSYDLIKQIPRKVKEGQGRTFRLWSLIAVRGSVTEKLEDSTPEMRSDLRNPR